MLDSRQYLWNLYLINNVDNIALLKLFNSDNSNLFSWSRNGHATTQLKTISVFNYKHTFILDTKLLNLPLWVEHCHLCIPQTVPLSLFTWSRYPQWPLSNLSITAGYLNFLLFLQGTMFWLWDIPKLIYPSLLCPPLELVSRFWSILFSFFWISVFNLYYLHFLVIFQLNLLQNLYL